MTSCYGPVEKKDYNIKGINWKCNLQLSQTIQIINF